MKSCNECGTLNMPKYEVCQKCGSEDLKRVEYQRNKAKPKVRELKDTYGYSK